MSPAVVHRFRFTVAALVSCAFAGWVASGEAARTFLLIVWLYIVTGSRG